MSDQTLEDIDVGEEARRIVEESLGMEDKGPLMNVDEECVECRDTTTWQSPTGVYYCNYHASRNS